MNIRLFQYFLGPIVKTNNFWKFLYLYLLMFGTLFGALGFVAGSVVIYWFMFTGNPNFSNIALKTLVFLFISLVALGLFHYLSHQPVSQPKTNSLNRHGKSSAIQTAKRYVTNPLLWRSMFLFVPFLSVVYGGIGFFIVGSSALFLAVFSDPRTQETAMSAFVFLPFLIVGLGGLYLVDKLTNKWT